VKKTQQFVHNPPGIHLDQFPSLPLSPPAARAVRLTAFHAFLDNFIRVSDASPRSAVLFKGSRLLHNILSQQGVPVADAFKCADDLQHMLQQHTLAPVLVAAMKAGSNLTPFQQGGWQAAARALLSPPEAWQDVNFHLVMKCIDACQCKADECKAARDLKQTEKRIDEEKAFLLNSEKKAEIKKGYIDKKLAAAKAAAAPSLIDMKTLEAEADAKVAEVLRNKEAAIEKNESSLPQKRSSLLASAEYKIWSSVERVWKDCGAAAIQKEFETLDRCACRVRAACCCSFQHREAFCCDAPSHWQSNWHGSHGTRQQL
jgi:uncharacterized protein YunC (DUF1805 family)